MRLPLKRAADLQEALPQRPAHRHSDGPSVLNGGDVLADLAAILRRQAFKPVSDRLGAHRRPIERRSDLLQTLPTNIQYQKWYGPLTLRSGRDSVPLVGPSVARQAVVEVVIKFTGRLSPGRRFLFRPSGPLSRCSCRRPLDSSCSEFM